MKSLHSILHQEEADTMSGGLGLRVGDGYHDDDVTKPTVCDEDLAAVDDVIIAVFNGVCSDALEVTTRIRSYELTHWDLDKMAENV